MGGGKAPGPIVFRGCKIEPQGRSQLVVSCGRLFTVGFPHGCSEKREGLRQKMATLNHFSEECWGRLLVAFSPGCAVAPTRSWINLRHFHPKPNVLSQHHKMVIDITIGLNLFICLSTRRAVSWVPASASACLWNHRCVRILNSTTCLTWTCSISLNSGRVWTLV